MVTPGQRHHRYTYAQYVVLERESPTKHEFFDGEIYAMAGGSENPRSPARDVAMITSEWHARPRSRRHLRILGGPRWP
jgi:hypothetical protein